MNSALDTFERSLVAASRTLAAATPAETAVATPAQGMRERRRRPLRRWRALGFAARAGVALALLLACGGIAGAAYVVLAGGPARELPAFECQMRSGSVDTSIPAVTGSPLVDCAAAWPSASGGKEAAPPLAIWGAGDGQRLVAVVAPVSAGQPAGDQNWQRLPDSWTVDLPIVALTDQLANIDLPFSDDGPAPSCSYGAQDVATVRALLHDDGLDSWSVTLTAQGGGQPGGGCEDFTANVDGPSRTVELQAASAQGTSAPAITQTTGAPTGATTAPGNSQPSQQAAQTAPQSPAATAESAAHAKLKQLYASVNATLSASCESVADAAALWTQAAGAAGFTPATLAFWHAMNTGQPDPTTVPYHYTLYQQPASQDTGNCAHVLVMVVPGSGLANVYVARITP